MYVVAIVYVQQKAVAIRITGTDSVHCEVLNEPFNTIQVNFLP
jgi:hypothetical protein